MSATRASLAALSLSLISGCGSQSGFKESIELVVDEKVAIKVTISELHQSLQKSNGELLSLISASCELPHRIQEVITPSTDAAVAVKGSSASATRDHIQGMNSSARSDRSANKLGLLSQKMTMSSESEGEVKLTSTYISSIPLKPLTPDMFREQGVELAEVGGLNSHMAFYEHLRSKHKLQSEAKIVYRKVSMNATGNGSEESVVRVEISDDKLRCEKIVSRNHTLR